MAQKKQQKHWLANSLVRVTHVHFFYVAALVTQIILYDAGKLITPEAVMWRWLATACLLVIVTAVWYLAKLRTYEPNGYKWLLLLLIAADIAIASFCVYTQRGMASRGVMLYAVPIITSAVLLSRTALYGTALLCIAAYFSTAISYFVLNFNEGYKIELYGEVGFYSTLFLILASLLWAVVRTKRKT